MPSTAAERFRSWVAAESSAAPLVRFRVAFGAIWLAYDLTDVLGSGTARIHNWLGTTAPSGLVALQLGLIACEGAMVLGRPASFAPPVLLLATLLRAAEWQTYLHLNDFAYYAVTALILAHARAPGGLLGMPLADMRAPRWPRDVLVLEAAWIYFATALMKTNPTWLSGKHLFVRLEYMRALGWPYPDVVERCADSLRCDGALAAMGVLAELTLAGLLVLHPRRRLVTPIALGIHVVGALATNVWFFGPSLVAQVALLTD
jgi:hypothetical protein